MWHTKVSPEPMPTFPETFAMGKYHTVVTWEAVENYRLNYLDHDIYTVLECLEFSIVFSLVCVCLRLPAVKG